MGREFDGTSVSARAVRGIVAAALMIGGLLVNGASSPAAAGDPVVTSISVGTVVEGNAGTSSVPVTVMLDRPVDVAATIDYSTSDGTAVQPGDYVAGSGTLDIAIGERSVSFSVVVVGDARDEPDEQFSINLSNAVGVELGTNDAAVVTIPDDDPSVSLFVTPLPAVTEGDPAFPIRFTLSAPNAEDIDIVLTVSGSVSNSDYSVLDAAPDGFGGYVLTMPAGTSNALAMIEVIDDSVAEPQENFAFSAYVPSLGVSGSATTTLDDNDNETFAWAVTEGLLLEGQAYVDVSLTGPSTTSRSVAVTVADGVGTTLSSESITLSGGEQATIGLQVPFDSDTAAAQRTVTLVAADGTSVPGPLTVDVVDVLSLGRPTALGALVPGQRTSFTIPVVVDPSAPAGVNITVGSDDLSSALVDGTTTAFSCTATASGASCAFLGASVGDDPRIVVSYLVPSPYTGTGGCASGPLSCADLSVQFASEPGITASFPVDAGTQSPGLSGRIVDDAGAGLSGYCATAYTRVYDPAGPPILSERGSACAAADGSYTIDGLDPGEYVVEASDASRTRTTWWDAQRHPDLADPVTVVAGTVTAGIDFTFFGQGRVTGSVRGADGGPLTSFCVEAYREPFDLYVTSTCVNPDGMFEFAALDAGDYSFRAVAGDVNQWYSGASSPEAATVVTVTADETTANIDFVLGGTGGVSGTVRDSNGYGVADIQIRAVSSGGAQLFGTTNTSGEYTITGLATGAWKLQRSGPASGSWYADQSDEANADPVTVIADVIVSGIDFAVPAGSIHGQVTRLDTGQGVGGVEVAVYTDDPAVPSYYDTTVTAPDGSYALGGIPAGTYVVRFTPAAGSGLAAEYWNGAATAAAADHVTLTATDNLTLDAQLPRGGNSTVTGVVSDSAGPVAGVTVIATGLGCPCQGTTGADGRYTIVGLQAGTYTVQFVPDPASGLVAEFYDNVTDVAQATAISVPESAQVPQSIDATLDRVSTGGTISGTVTQDSDGAPLAGVDVVVSDGTIERHATTGGDGTYLLSGLPDGSYTVRFVPPSGYVAEYYENSISPAYATSLVISATNGASGIDARLAAVPDPVVTMVGVHDVDEGTSFPVSLDVVGGVAPLQYEWSSSDAVAIDTTFNPAAPMVRALNDGAMHLTVTVADALGHSVSVTETFTVANVAPTGTLSLDGSTGSVVMTVSNLVDPGPDDFASLQIAWDCGAGYGPAGPVAAVLVDATTATFDCGPLSGTRQLRAEVFDDDTSTELTATFSDDLTIVLTSGFPENTTLHEGDEVVYRFAVTGALPATFQIILHSATDQLVVAAPTWTVEPGIGAGAGFQLPDDASFTNSWFELVVTNTAGAVARKVFDPITILNLPPGIGDFGHFRQIGMDLPATLDVAAWDPLFEASHSSDDPVAVDIDCGDGQGFGPAVAVSPFVAITLTCPARHTVEYFVATVRATDDEGGTTTRTYLFESVDTMPTVVPSTPLGSVTAPLNGFEVQSFEVTAGVALVAMPIVRPTGAAPAADVPGTVRDFYLYDCAPGSTPATGCEYVRAVEEPVTITPVVGHEYWLWPPGYHDELAPQRATRLVTVLPLSVQAVDDSLTAPVGASSMTIDATELLANDFDPEGDRLDIVSVSAPVTLAGATITVPLPDPFSTPVTFTYVVSDGSDTSTATVTVRPPATQPYTARIVGRVTSVNESGGLPLAFDVSIEPTPTEPVVVRVEVDGSGYLTPAIPGVDFVVPADLTLTFAVGETLRTVEFSPIDDSVNEWSELFGVRLAAVSENVQIAEYGGESAGQIYDDTSEAGVIRIDASAPASADEGSTITVDVSSPELTLPPNGLTYHLVVLIDANLDGTFEPWSTLDVGPFGGLAYSVKVGPLPDGPATIRIEVVGSDFSGNSGSATLDIDVLNVAPSASFVAPGSATAGAQFSLALTDATDATAVDRAGLSYAFDCGSGTFSAPSPTPSVTCTAPSSGTSVPVRGRVIDPDGGVGEYRAAVSLTGVPVPSASLSLGPPDVVEGDAGTLLIVTLDQVSAVPVTVEIAFDPSGLTDPATEGDDVSAGLLSPFTVTVPANTLTTAVPLTIVDDAIVERAESILLRLQNPGAGVSVGLPATALLVIRDNDHAPLAITATAPPLVDEGSPLAISVATTDAIGTVTYDVAVAVDGVNDPSRALVDVSGPTVTLTNLPDGPATLRMRVTATDSASPARSVSQEVTVEIVNVNPSVTLVAPGSATVGTQFSLSMIGASDATAVDRAGLAYAFDCGSGTFTPASATSTAVCTAPPSGTVVVVRAQVIDPDGGVGEYSATVSLTPAAPAAPDTTIVSGPLAQTTATVAEFTMSSTVASATFECSLDGADYVACESPALYTDLVVGAHEFRVRSLAAGVADPTPATFRWTILAPPPPPPPPPPVALTLSAHFDTPSTVTEGDRRQVILDLVLNGPAPTAITIPITVVAAGSGQAPPAGVVVPSNEVTIRAGDRSGSIAFTIVDDEIVQGTRRYDVKIGPMPPGLTFIGASTMTFIVLDDDGHDHGHDHGIEVPDTSLTRHPGESTSSTAASFAFTSSDAAADFQCSLDGSRFVRCTSPWTYSSLAPGGHMFAVRAGRQGRFDPTPAAFAWAIIPAPASGFSIAVADPGPVDESSRVELVVTPTGAVGEVRYRLLVTSDDGAGPREVTSGLRGVRLPALNGPAEVSVIVTGEDGAGRVATAALRFEVRDVAPVASFSTPSRWPGDRSFTLRLRRATDPSAADRPTLQYRFDCGDGLLGDWSSSNRVRCPGLTGEQDVVVRGEVRDQDGLSSTYSRTLHAQAHALRVTVSAATDQTVASIVWSDPTSGVTGFDVYRRRHGEPDWTRLATTDSTVREYADTAIGVFDYAVVSIGTAGEIDRVAVLGVPVGRPSAPTKLTATVAGSVVTLTWRGSAIAATYAIQRRTLTVDGSWTDWVVVPRGDPVAMVETDVPGPGTHEFRVAAGSDAGASGWTSLSAPLTIV